MMNEAVAKIEEEQVETPETSVEAPEPAVEPDEQLDFIELMGDETDEDEDYESSLEEKAPATEKEEEAEVKEEVTEPTEGEQAPAAEEAEPKTEVKPTEPQKEEVVTQEASPEQTLTPEQQKAQYDEVMANLEKYYQIDDATLEAFEMEPGKELPKMLARVHMSATLGMLQRLQQEMPAMLQQHTSAADQQRQYEDAFFKQWPQIDRNNQQHVETVARLGMAYRQANPQVSAEVFMRDVGAQAAVSLGLGGQQQQTPAPQQKGNVEPAPGSPSYSPAQGAIPPRPTNPETENPITVFDRIFDEDGDI